MVAWWIAAGTAVFGTGPFGIRALTVLSAIPIFALMYACGRVLFDRPIAARGTLWLNATLLVGVGGFIATPDAPSLVFWTAALLGFLLVVRTGDGRWWLLVGAATGLGIVSKLTDLFLLPGLLLPLLIRRDLRHWLINPWTWAGVVLAAAIVAPLVAWNAGHGWVTFASQFSRVTAGHLVPLKPPEFVAGQFALLNPFVAVFVGLAVVAWVRRLPAYPTDGIGLLAWTALPLVAYMAFHSLHQEVQANWPTPVYSTLVLMAAAAAGSAPPRWDGWRILAFPVGAILIVIGLVLSGNPGGIVPLALDPASPNRGWEAVAAETDAFRRQSDAKWIGAGAYGVVSELSYRLAGTVPVIPVEGRLRFGYRPLPDPALAAEPGLIVSANPDGVAGCYPGAVRVGTILRKTGDSVIDTFGVFTVPSAPPAVFVDGCR
ncbi:MAG: glycosyltransferase family 39 protein [Bauldia sp.]